MPELPEVETVARSLRAHLVGRTASSVWTSGLPLRRPIDAAAIERACVRARALAVERVGKYLVLRFSSERALLVHLGMTGRLLFVEAPGRSPRPPHTHLVLALDGESELRYVDARRFGHVAAYPEAGLPQSDELAVLGVDPLDAAFTAEHLGAVVAGSRRDVKLLLLNQGRIAGLGNIYACEALHRAGISPRRRADRLGHARIDRLHAAIREVLESAVARRGTTLRDYVDADGEGGGNQHHLCVYGREGEPCRCGAPIRRLVQGARSTFFCPRCQR